MLQIERQEQIMELLGKTPAMRIGQIAAALYISEATVRRDLSAMEQKGLVRRVYGGVTLKKEDMPLELRRQEHAAAKEEIALRATALLRDGMTVFLDSSSTVQHLLPHLTRFHDMTVITNSPATSIALGECGIRNFCTGGELSSRSVSFVGGYAQDFIRGFNADIAFISCRGLSEDGLLTESNVEFVHVKKQMLKNAKRRVFLCDRSKFERTYPHRLATQDEFDDVIIE